MIFNVTSFYKDVEVLEEDVRNHLHNVTIIKAHNLVVYNS